MNKIPASSWIKMAAIVSIHLWIVGWGLYCFREPIGNFASVCWGGMVASYDCCAGFLSDAWEKVPSPEQLVDGFIRILKLEPFR